MGQLSAHLKVLKPTITVLCRWGGDESGSEDDPSTLSDVQKQSAVTQFLKAALTDTLLSVTNSMFRDIAKYATLTRMPAAPTASLCEDCWTKHCT